jgi:hypothetical protein
MSFMILYVKTVFKLKTDNKCLTTLAFTLGTLGHWFILNWGKFQQPIKRKKLQSFLLIAR